MSSCRLMMKRWERDRSRAGAGRVRRKSTTINGEVVPKRLCVFSRYSLRFALHLCCVRTYYMKQPPLPFRYLIGSGIFGQNRNLLVGAVAGQRKIGRAHVWTP